MTTPAQQHNLQELIVALQGIHGDDPLLSPTLLTLLKEGLHHSHMPDTLKPSAAEFMQLIMEGTGGVARGILWADRNYGAFMKLYARQTIPTISPVLPPAPTSDLQDQWPEWMTARRLAYQVRPPETEPEEGTSDA